MKKENPIYDGRLVLSAKAPETIVAEVAAKEN
jgi:hypothetical protein